MGMKVFRIIIYIVSILGILSGYFMASVGHDYERGTFMLIAGFGTYIILQVGAIYELVRDAKKKVIYKP